MTVNECVDSWDNGNRKHVVEYVLALSTKVEVAFHVAGIVYLLDDRDGYAFK